MACVIPSSVVQQRRRQRKASGQSGADLHRPPASALWRGGPYLRRAGARGAAGKRGRRRPVALLRLQPLAGPSRRTNVVYRALFVPIASSMPVERPHAARGVARLQRGLRRPGRFTELASVHPCSQTAPTELRYRGPGARRSPKRCFRPHRCSTSSSKASGWLQQRAGSPGGRQLRQRRRQERRGLTALAASTRPEPCGSGYSWGRAKREVERGGGLGPLTGRQMGDR